eukprot:gene3576-4092_t
MKDIIIILFVTFISISSAATIGGYIHNGQPSLTITGAGFDNTSVVRFTRGVVGDITPTVANYSTIIATIPLSLSNGDMAVVTNGILSNIVSYKLTPSVTSPMFMLSTIGGTITIKGNYFNLVNSANQTIFSTVTCTFPTSQVYWSCENIRQSNNQEIICDYPAAGGDGYKCNLGMDNISAKPQPQVAFYSPAAVPGTHIQDGFKHTVKITNFTTWQQFSLFYQKNLNPPYGYTTPPYSYDHATQILTLDASGLYQQYDLYISCTYQRLTWQWTLSPVIVSIKSVPVVGGLTEIGGKTFVKTTACYYGAANTTIAFTNYIPATLRIPAGTGLNVPFWCSMSDGRNTNVFSFNHGPDILSNSILGDTITVIGDNFNNDGNTYITISGTKVIPSSIEPTKLIATVPGFVLPTSSFTINSSSIQSASYTAEFTPDIQSARTSAQGNILKVMFSGNFITINPTSVLTIDNVACQSPTNSDGQTILCQISLPSDTTKSLAVSLTINGRSDNTFSFTPSVPKITFDSQRGTKVYFLATGFDKLTAVSATLQQANIQCFVEDMPKILAQNISCQLLSTSSDGSMEFTSTQLTTSVPIKLNPVVASVSPLFPIGSQIVTVQGGYFQSSSMMITITNGASSFPCNLVQFSLTSLTCTYAGALVGNSHLSITLGNHTSNSMAISYSIPTMTSFQVDTTLKTGTISGVVTSAANITFGFPGYPVHIPTCHQLASQVVCDLSGCDGCLNECTTINYDDTVNEISKLFVKRPHVISIEPGRSSLNTNLTVEFYCPAKHMMYRYVEVEFGVDGRSQYASKYFNIANSTDTILEVMVPPINQVSSNPRVVVTYEEMVSIDNSWVGGNCLFEVEGKDLPGNPVLSIRSLSTAANDFTFQSSRTTTDQTVIYVYLSPESPYDNSKKRPLTDVFSFHLLSNGVELMTGQFLYLNPSIDSFQPTDTQILKCGQKQLRLIGTNLMLMDTDPLPVVKFGAVQATVVHVKSTEITVRVPDYPAPNNVDVDVTLYSSAVVTSAIQFRFVSPYLTKVTPNRVVSGLAQVIEIDGLYLLDDPNNVESVITIGASLCTNVIPISETRVQCTTVAQIVAQGKFDQQDITMTISQTPVQSNLKFTVYYPEILTISTHIGLASGGDTIVVTGLYLDDVTSVTIGNIPCVIDQSSIKHDEFKCTSGIFAMPAGENSQSFPLKVTVGTMVITSPATQEFAYFVPLITDIEPLYIMSKGVSKITINGFNFNAVDKISIGSVSVTTMSMSNTMTTLHVDIDAADHAVGNTPVTVSIGTYTSNQVPLKIVTPSISAPVTPAEGYLHSTTPITITVQDFPSFPLTITQVDLDQMIQFQVSGRPCTSLTVVPPSQFSCIAPAGTANGPNAITFSINGQAYTTDKVFGYFEPTFTAVTQTTTIPLGGGTFDIDGTNLQVVDGVKINNVDYPLGTCTRSPTKIQCTILPNRPGTYAVQMTANHITYAAPQQLVYVGPALDSISPIQGSKKRVFDVTLTGLGLGAVANMITVTIGPYQCTGVTIIAPTQITCSRPAGDQGSYKVSIFVNTGTGPIESMDDITFTNNGLSCLGRPLADQSNTPVDWWFTYKLKGPQAYSGYLYQDINMESLEKYNGLTNVNGPPFSPLAATFDQRTDYNYLMFNDQPGSRDANGARADSKHKSHGSHGHLKGMVFWEMDALGQSNGIHILHSNPHYPAYRSATNLDYYNADEGIYFLGAPDYNQHFFCYQFTSLDSVAKYFLYNDGNLLATNNYPDMSAWTMARRNQYPNLYDMLAPYQSPVWPARVGGTPVTSAALIRQTCQTAIGNNANVQNLCYWESPAFMIGGRRANYFMTTSIDKIKARFPPIQAVNPPTISRYVIANLNIRNGKKPTYEGVDIWMVVANFYQRSMFVEFFYAIGMVQAQTFQEVINIGYLHLPANLATASPPDINGQITYTDNQFSGGSNDHAKIGWPIYPKYGANALNQNENMFCFGDSNRHNGQGTRGGGVIVNDPGPPPKVVDRVPKNTEGVFLAEVIAQPIKINRAMWANDVIVEIRDAVGGQTPSQVPRNLKTLDATTLANPNDYVSTFSALRTSVANVLAPNVISELSVMLNPPTLPNQPDIMSFVADDTLSMFYQAIDPTIGCICDADPKFTTGTLCNTIATARYTQLLEVAGVPIVYPNIAQSAYGNLQPLRTFDLLTNIDFLVLSGAQAFRAAMTNPPTSVYQIIVDIAAKQSNIKPPFIIRQTSTNCPDELSYLMLLNDIFIKSKAVDATSIVFKINTDAPNWVNGMILAISKKIFNTIPPIIGKSSAFDPCMATMFPLMTNLITYLEASPVNVLTPTQQELFYRTAAATWDLMDDINIADGKGGRILRTTVTDVLTWQQLLTVVIDLKPSDNIQSLAQLLGQRFGSNINTPTTTHLLVNNYLIQDTQIKGRSLVKSAVTTITPTLSSLSLSPLYQLLDSGYFTEDDITGLSEEALLELDIALGRWIEIEHETQAITTLLYAPVHQSDNQPIVFIDEINRDYIDSVVTLCLQASGNGFQVCSPMSITSITYFLESAIDAASTTRVSMGDLEVYFLEKPVAYNGTINATYTGMAIATVNSLLCDIAMVVDPATFPVDSICIPSTGPLISSVSSITGPAIGGASVTIEGLGFTTDMKVRIGGRHCNSTQFINTHQVICTTPSGINPNHPITLYRPSIGSYDLQRTKFYYSYHNPIIATVKPNPMDSNGGILTVRGMHFGNNWSDLKVKIDMMEYLADCYPIISLNDSMITCSLPVGAGLYRNIQVTVGSQTSNLNFNTRHSAVNYEAPRIFSVLPDSGDPDDFVLVHGDGFGIEPSDLTLLVNQARVPVSNFTDNLLTFKLGQLTGTPNISILVAQQGASSTTFSYYPPYMHYVNISRVHNVTGGQMLIQGAGWGLVQDNIDYVHLGATSLSCQPFNTFIECTVPPGISPFQAIHASVNGVPAQISPPLQAEYFLYPLIHFLEHIINASGNHTLVVTGDKFWPDNGQFTNDTFLEVGNPVTRCYGPESFINSTTIRCSIPFYPSYIFSPDQWPIGWTSFPFWGKNFTEPVGVANLKILLSILGGEDTGTNLPVCMTARHWEKLNTADRVVLDFDDVEFDEDDVEEKELELMRKIFSIKGPKVTLDVMFVRLTPILLDLLETIDCLVSVRSLGEDKEEEANPVFHRFLDLILEHRQTLEEVHISGYDKEYMDRWLDTLNTFPCAKHNSIYNVEFTDSQISRYFDTMAANTVIDQVELYIDSDKLANQFISSLGRRLPCHSQTIMIEMPTSKQLYALDALLLQPGGYQEIRISLTHDIFNDDHSDDAPSKAVVMKLHDSIEYLSLRSRADLAFVTFDFTTFHAPNLVTLVINIAIESSEHLFVLADVLTGHVDNLQSFEIEMAHKSLTRDSLSSILGAIGSHPNLRSLKLQQFQHPDLLIAAIQKSPTLQSIAWYHFANKNAKDFHFAIMESNIFQRTRTDRYFTHGYRVIDEQQ